MTAAWNFACPDWGTRLAEGRSLLPALPLDAQKAEQAVRIWNKLRVPDIAGQPPFGEAGGEWFRDIVRAIFGSLDDAGVRHVPEVFALVGKKNAKTTKGAGLMLTALLVNKVPRAEFLLVAPTQEIADLAFQQIAGMIEADPAGYLAKRYHVQDHKKTIQDRVNKAFLKVKTFDMRVMTGAKPLGVLIDELHIMGSIHYAARVIGQIRGALQAKPGSFLLTISTQSDEPPAGVFRAELQYARGVRDGRITGQRVRTLPLLYEFPEKLQTHPDKPWREPKYWPMVMPNLGRSLTLESMVAGYQAAREKGEEEERRWASQHLNVEIGLALHSDRWRGADYWEAATDPALTLESLIARSDVITVGADGGGDDDLFGLAVLGRDAETSDWLLWTRGWMQPEVLERRKDIAPRLRDFVKQGDLVICERAGQDVEEIADIVERIHLAGLLPERSGVGLDPSGVNDLVDELVAREILLDQDGGPVCGVGQGGWLKGAIFGMERRLKFHTLWHCAQEIMAWCVSNAKLETTATAVRITKQASGRAKIDLLIAALNAAHLMSAHPKAAGRRIDDFLNDPVMVV